MIRPYRFEFNSQTAVNNSFQVADNDHDVSAKAQREFDGFVAVLRRVGVEVIVMDDTPDPHTPDAIFPNNWISFHKEHTICLYPMFAENRRQERKPALIEAIIARLGVNRVVDFSHYEAGNRFLEGTGSMVLDRDNHLVYACLSPRTDETLLKAWCDKMEYQPVLFHATDTNGKFIYHTNVMMCVADRYAIVCLDSISPTERQMLVDKLEQSGKAVISISMMQVEHFAGNMLQVQNKDGEKLLVMSSQAFHSLSVDQVYKLKTYNDIIHASIDTIETNGGDSARCMIAEIFI